MRISDDRYRRERSRLQVALRFLEHEARTKTIRAWTGLSADRIRKLHHSYTAKAGHYAVRHRGKSPHQLSYFARSVRMQQETLWLACMLSLLGAIPPEPSEEESDSLPNIARGELICTAFETYRAMVSDSQISFEHAVFLTTALSRGEQLRFGNCKECDSLVLVEVFQHKEKRCHACVIAKRR
jgi:hypothetical protein